MKKRIEQIKPIKLSAICMIFMIILCCVSSVLAENQSSAEITDANYANLVVYVNFSDTVHAHTSSYWGKCFLEDPEIETLFNGVDTKNSMYHYLKNISNGNLRVKSIFPQLQNDGKIIPLTLSGTAASYADNKDAIVAEVASYLSNQSGISKDTVLDYDQDGLVDNLMLVIPCETDNTNTLYNGLAWTYAGSDQLNGKYIKPINIITESGVYLGTSGSAQAIHEFMHTLGFPDLYTSSNTTAPVGGWDIMSTLYMQYPLAYMRYKNSNHTWIEKIDTLTADRKNVTLYAPSAAARTTATQEIKDHQAVILKTSASDEEFFVVEYRKKITTDPYDQHLYGDGLIIYRINNAVPYKSNYKSDQYYLYVFRPNDTFDSAAHKESAAIGGLYTSFLSSESGRTSYGTSDLSKGLADGAITFSDGSNSGIVISNVGSASGDSMTFDVTFPEQDEDHWQTCGTLSPSVQMCSAVDTEGTLYILNSEAYGSENNICKVTDDGLKKIYSGPQGTCYDMTFYDGKLYVCYADQNFQGKTAIYDSNGLADTITLPDTINDQMKALTIEDGVVAAYTVSGSGFGQKIKAVKINGSTYTELGDTIERSETNYPCLLDLVSNQGKPTLIYREAFAQKQNTIVTVQYNNQQWQVLDDSKIASNAALAADHTGLYLIASDAESAVCYRYDSGWKSITEERIELENISGLDVCVKDGILYVMCSKSDTNDALTQVYTISSEGVDVFGTKLSSGPSNSLGIHTINDMVYAAFSSSLNNTLSLKKMKALKSAAQTAALGDINADDEINAVDALQALRHSVSEITLTGDAFTRGDVYKDNKVDATDALQILRYSVKEITAF